MKLEHFRAELLPEDKVTAVEELRRSYGAVAMVGEEKVRDFDKYFRWSIAGFNRGTTNLYRITLRRWSNPRINIVM